MTGVSLCVLQFYFYKYSGELETNSFTGDTAGYVWFFTIIWGLLLTVAALMNNRLIGGSLTMAVIYLWANRNGDRTITFWFGIKFKVRFSLCVCVFACLRVGGVFFFFLMAVLWWLFLFFSFACAHAVLTPTPLPGLLGAGNLFPVGADGADGAAGRFAGVAPDWHCGRPRLLLPRGSVPDHQRRRALHQDAGLYVLHLPPRAPAGL